MMINADYTKPATVVARDASWCSNSPQMEGVWLDRASSESVRGTTLVRFFPGSPINRQIYTAGSEVLVLDGTISDESGEFRKLSYLRNPPGTPHVPHSTSGCTIFLKLSQLAASDRTRLAIDASSSADWVRVGARGLQCLRLFSGHGEQVDLLRVPEGLELTANGATGGFELLVVEGEIVDSGGRALPEWSWLRLPPGERAGFTASRPCVLFRKTGHLFR